MDIKKRKHVRTRFGLTPAWEVLLQVIYHLTYDIKYGELTVLAWKADKTRFGLCGYRSIYPDAKRVSATIQHLISKGMIARITENTYRITREGIDMCERLGIEEYENELQSPTRTK